MNVNIDLSDLKTITNPVYCNLYNDTNRYLVLWGGAGSGKSWFVAQKKIVRILRAMEAGYKHRVLALRKTQPAVRKSVYALFKNTLVNWGLYQGKGHPKNVCEINRTEMTFDFLGGSDIICTGLDDPEKLKSIEGVTDIWLEEPTELSVDDWRQIDLRLRGVTASYKQIALSFNPVSALSWIHNEFFTRPKKNATLVHTTHLDNQFIDDEYREVLEGLIDEDENYYKIYTLGQWGVLKNVIYSKYKILVNKGFPKNFDEVIYGLDFGYTNPSSLISIGIKDETFYLKELLHETKLTNADLIEKIKLEIPDKNAYIWADSQEPARIEEFRRQSFNIHPAVKHEKQSTESSVKNGIDYCKRQTLHLHEDSVNLIQEIGGYKYKEDKDGNVLEVPVKFQDHACDAFRYALYSRYLKLTSGRPRVRLI